MANKRQKSCYTARGAPPLPKNMANSRNPTSWTPFTSEELAQQRAELETKRTAAFRREYMSMLGMCKLDPELPQYIPKPWELQTLVQIWRVLYKRTPKGRD